MGIVKELGVATKYIELDDSGSVIHLETIDSINDLVWSNESNKFIGAGGGLGTDTYLTGRVFKMNTSGEVIWDTIIGEGQNAWWGNQLYKIVKSLDNSGYVAGGTKKEYHPEEEQNDEIGTTISQGWLVKIDEEGEVLWERTYHYIDTPTEEHTLNDLKATSDGGYIFCGESRDLDIGQPFSEGPPQQGWLVKVDEHGCLVEGCQLSDGINVIESQKEIEYFMAGPIPAGQFLNIYQSATAHQATYELINQNGQIIEEFVGMSKGTTLMLDVSKYAPGSYQLVLMEGNKILQRQKIIME